MSAAHGDHRRSDLGLFFPTSSPRAKSPPRDGVPRGGLFWIVVKRLGSGWLGPGLSVLPASVLAVRRGWKRIPSPFPSSHRRKIVLTPLPGDPFARSTPLPGQEMTGPSISHWLVNTIERTGNAGDGHDLMRAYRRHDVMLASVVRLNVSETKVVFKVAAQGYRSAPDPYHWRRDLSPTRWPGMSR